MRDPKPKVLFFAYSLPPRNAAASVRTWNIAKYLSRSGWDVTVVSPDPSQWRNIEDSQGVAINLQREGIRRLTTGHRWRCLSPDALQCWNRGIGWMIGGVCRKVARHFAIESEVGWIKEAEAACESLTPDDVDIILATAPPFVSFWLAKRLSEKLKRPYVLDYRDPWVVRSDSAFAAMQSTQELEKHLIEHSSAVTVVSQSLLNGRLGVNEKLHVITNGFDPEEFDHIEPFKFGHFAIVYAGSFYPPKRVITPLMQALGRLGSNDRARTVEWKFHYYGIHGDHVYKEARRFGVTDKIVIHGRVPRAEALSAVRGSNVTVVITSVIEEKAEQDRGIVTGKIFDSLGMCIPVLLIGPPEADVDHIIETAGLTRKVTAQDIHGMVSFLEEAMTGSTLKANRPDVYAWPNVIRKLDAILRNALDSQLH